jgi:HSP20 family protein
MPDIVRWEPFRDLISLRDAMDRLFEESVVRPRGWLAPFGGENLAVDVYETDQDVVIKTSLPGVKPEDIDISVVGDTVTIKGEAKEESEVKEESYVRRERRFGSFCRTVPLPNQVVADKAEARFEHGVLTLTLPKAEEVKPKSIKVKPS